MTFNLRMSALQELRVIDKEEDKMNRLGMGAGVQELQVEE
jgi:hypothetical protein